MGIEGRMNDCSCRLTPSRFLRNPRYQAREKFASLSQVKSSVAYARSFREETREIGLSKLILTPMILKLIDVRRRALGALPLRASPKTV